MIALRRLLAFVVFVIAGAAFAGGANAAAERHLRLLKSEPAEGAVLEAVPPAVELWFSEAPEVTVTTVQLVTPTGESHKLANVTADAEDATHIVAATDSLAGSGSYSIGWRTMSRDGHVVTGEFAFEVKAKD